MPATKSQVQLANERIFEWLQDDSMKKEAADTINDFTRTRIREDGFARRIMPPLPISNEELDRQYWTDKPVKIIDKEPDIPPAISVPYGALPINWYIRGPRYQVTFERILSPRFTKDVSELRTWTMDIRQVISDNAIKDMLAEEDSKFIAAVNTALIAQNAVTPTSGAVQWKKILGGITRDSWKDSLKVMPSTQFHLEAATVLMNNVTVYELQKWGRDEWGGDGSEKLLTDGWNLKRFDNRDILITNKRDLVPDNTFYHFADPKFMGRAYELEAITMYVDRRFFMLEFFAFEEIGGSFGHTGGLARIDVA